MRLIGYERKNRKQAFLTKKEKNKLNWASLGTITEVRKIFDRVKMKNSDFFSDHLKMHTNVLFFSFLFRISKSAHI